jgi:predicted metalloprotease with PDZ domain
MNDFCQIFYAGSPNVPALKTYKFEDIVAVLNTLAPYDWTTFLRAHLDGLSTRTPLEAVENNGWKLIYSEEPNEMQVIESALARRTNLTFTIGMTVQEDGTVDDVTHGGLAYDAGVGPGMKIIAVNGKQYSPDEIKQAIAGSKFSTAPIQLIVANGAQFQTRSIDYHGGTRFPHLVRDTSRPDYMSEILKPMVAASGTAQATPAN